MARQPLIDARVKRMDSRAKTIEDALSQAMTPTYAPSKSLRPKPRPTLAPSTSPRPKARPKKMK
jgi:hypothetical protein